MKKIYLLTIAAICFCMTLQAQVTVNYVANAFDNETAWLLWDATDQVPLAQRELGVNQPFGTPTTVTVFPPTGNAIELYTYESFGDGWNGCTIELVCGGTSIFGPADPGTSGCDATGSVVDEVIIIETIVSPCTGELTEVEVSALAPDPGGAQPVVGAPCPADLIASCTAPVNPLVGCDIICPDDLVLNTDPGVCTSNASLPGPTFDPADCNLTEQVDFVETTTGDQDLAFTGGTFAGGTFCIPAGPAPAVCVDEVAFTFCWTTDNGGSGAGFESAAITFPAPLINPATFENLNGNFPANGTVIPAGASGTDTPQGGPLFTNDGMPTGNGDCTEACVDIVVSLADYANWNGGCFDLSADTGINLFCADNSVNISTNIATDCAPYSVTIEGVTDANGNPLAGAAPSAVAAGVDFPIGTTTVCYVATGSANGMSFPVSCKFDVTVCDMEAPTLTCPGDFTFNLQGGECCQKYDFEVITSDNCPGPPSSVVGPFCDPCADPSGGSALACGAGPNAILQVISGVEEGFSLTEVCYNQETFGTTTTAVVNVYCYDGVTIPFDDGMGTFTPFATTNATLGNDGECICIDFLDMTNGTYPTIPVGCTEIVVEVVNATGRSVQTPAACDGATADGGLTYIFAPACGLTSPVLFSGIGFALDAGFSVSLIDPAFPEPVENPNAVVPAGATLNEFESGDELPVGIHCWAFTATDAAGNTSECDWCVQVNAIPEDQVVTSLACNDLVNLSLDANCMTFISADMFLEGGPYGCYFDCYEVYITDQFDNPVVSGCGDDASKTPGGDPVFGNTNPNDVNGCTIDLPCGEYKVMVYDACNDNTCWGNLLVEDKIAPVVIPPADVTLNCLQSVEPGTPINGEVNVAAEANSITWDDGTTGDVGELTFTIPPQTTGAVITDINIDISLAHSWAGDVTIEVEGPDGNTVDIYNRHCANNNNIDVTVDEEGTIPMNSCAACAFLGGTTEDCPGLDETAAGYCATVNSVRQSNELASGAGPGLTQWYGLPVGGTFTVRFGDAVGGDGGCLEAFSMNITWECPAAGMATIENGCGTESLDYQDEYFDNGCGGSRIVRTWFASDEKGNMGTAQSQVFITQVGLEGENSEWFWPNSSVDLTCGACTDPECIYDFCRSAWEAANPWPESWVIDPEWFEDDIAVWNANANAAGTVCAYPYFLTKGGTADRFDINNCNMFYSYTDQLLPVCGAGCDGNSKTIRTWTALDWCTGETANAVQVIHAKDNEGPTIDLVEQHTVSASPWGCAASFILPVPEHLKDNCSSDVTYTVYGKPGTVTDVSSSPYFDGANWVVAGLPKGGPHEYTYVAEDCCGNSTSATLIVFVVDSTPPIATATQNIVINLTSSPTDPNGGIAKLYATSVDNGSNDGDCGPVRIAIRRVEADEDAEENDGFCGNLGVDDHNSNATFFNFNDLPNSQQPADHSRDDLDNGEYVKFCCADLSGEDAVFDSITGMTYALIDVELGVWDDSNMDGVPGTPGDQFNKTWATVRVESKLEAVILCPPLAKITCDMDETDLAMTGTASATATCGNMPVEYMDLCGLDINQDMEIAGYRNGQTVNEVGMCWDVNGDGVIANYSSPSAAGSDAAGYIEEDFFNKACHNGPITRWWYIPGTDTKCRQIIIVEPNDNVFAGNGFDADDDGNCDADNPLEICPEIDWPYSRNAFINLVNNDTAADCDGDGRGNEISSSDIELFDNGGYPTYAEVAMDCIDALCEEPVWVNANCSLIGWSLESDTFYFEGDACRKIINTYTVIDWCQYNPNEGFEGIWTWTVIGKLIDPYAPIVEVQDTMFGVGGGGTGSNDPSAGSCVYGGFTACATAYDTQVDEDGDTIANACPSEWLKWNVYLDLNNDWVFEREWSSFVPEDKNTPADPLWSEDNADDNLDVYGYTIPDVAVGNTGDVDNADDIATPPGFKYIINIPDAVEADCDGSTQHRVVWKAYDGCGNVTSVTNYFTVQDVKAPTPFCINLSTALMADPDGDGPAGPMVELWAIDFNAGSFDNCTDPDALRYTFSDVAPEDDPDYNPASRSSARVFDCNDLAGSNNAVLTVNVYVWDQCGNYDFCVVNLRLIDNSGDCGNGVPTGSMIAGDVTTEFGEAVESVEIYNDNMLDPNLNTDDMTENDGHYAFEWNEEGSDYEITAAKNDDYLNGVSTLDLVIIQRHILGTESLDSPYKMIAADVNNDQKITAIDLIELRKLILGIYDELPTNSSWRFVDASQTLDINNPWNMDETINIYSLAADMMEEDFVGVKIGDVNGSVIANAQSVSPEKRSATTVDIVFEDRAVEVGELVEITVSGESMTEVYGYQFTLETPGLQLVDVTEGTVNVSSANFGSFNGKVTTSWNSLTPITQDGDLFTMTFKSTVSGQLSQLIDLNSSITKAEAYVGQTLDIVSVELRGGTGVTTYALYQNEPNPFSNRTMVGFELPEAGQATLTVLDVTGKVLKVINGDYAKGYNEVELSKSDFGAAGVYYYQLDSGDFTATKKMIIIE